MQLLQNCIGPTIRIGQESWCLPYAGFFCSALPRFWHRKGPHRRTLCSWKSWPTRDPESFSAGSLVCLCKAGFTSWLYDLLRTQDSNPRPCSGKTWIFWVILWIRSPYRFCWVYQEDKVIGPLGGNQGGEQGQGKEIGRGPRLQRKRWGKEDQGPLIFLVCYVCSVCCFHLGLQIVL